MVKTKCTIKGKKAFYSFVTDHVNDMTDQTAQRVVGSMKDNCGVELVRTTTISNDTKDGKTKKVKVLRVTTYVRTFLNGPQKRKSSTRDP